MIKKTIKGIVGITKAVTGIDRASDETIKKRTETCVSCEHYKFWVCNKCGCIVNQKVKVASESCPVGLWSQENGKTVE